MFACLYQNRPATRGSIEAPEVLHLPNIKVEVLRSAAKIGKTCSKPWPMAAGPRIDGIIAQCISCVTIKPFNGHASLSSTVYLRNDFQRPTARYTPSYVMSRHSYLKETRARRERSSSQSLFPLTTWLGRTIPGVAKVSP